MNLEAESIELSMGSDSINVVKQKFISVNKIKEVIVSNTMMGVNNLPIQIHGHTWVRRDKLFEELGL